MARDKLIIIGAGIAGLSAACYARMNGYDVEIFEKHILPGLDNFYMVGQWASASLGVSNVAMMARNFVKGICKQDRKSFLAG